MKKSNKNPAPFSCHNLLKVRRKYSEKSAEKKLNKTIEPQTIEFLLLFIKERLWGCIHACVYVSRCVCVYEFIVFVYLFLANSIIYTF